MTFSVELEVYRGPLDLLLYLVRKHELDVSEVSISTIAHQYVEHLEVLDQLSLDEVGEFIEIASLLVEIKSRRVLPTMEEAEEPLEDPREGLVERLLEYKKYKDAAAMLDHRGREWQKRHARLANDLPSRKLDPAEQPLHEVELWDLVSAFGRIIRDSDSAQSASIVYDDTPIQVYMERIHERVSRQGRASFSEMFSPGMHKQALIGVFLAVLELVRHHHVRAEQNDLHGEIYILPAANFSSQLDLSAIVDSYEHGALAADRPSDSQVADEDPPAGSVPK